MMRKIPKPQYFFLVSEIDDCARFLHHVVIKVKIPGKAIGGMAMCHLSVADLA